MGRRPIEILRVLHRSTCTEESLTFKELRRGIRYRADAIGVNIWVRRWLAIQVPRFD